MICIVMGQFDKLISHMERKLETLRKSNDKPPKFTEPLNVTKKGGSKLGELKVIKVSESVKDKVKDKVKKKVKKQTK